jgi:hypothetical protein
MARSGNVGNPFFLKVTIEIRTAVNEPGIFQHLQNFQQLLPSEHNLLSWKGFLFVYL